MAAAPPIENSAHDLTLLAADRKVVVTKEEQHQAALTRYAPWGSARRVAVELRVVRRGRQQVIEVLLDGMQVGELTPLMSRRYGPLVDDVLRRGGRPGCIADVVVGTRGIEVEVRLPAVAATPEPPRSESRRSRKPLWIGAGIVAGLLIIGGNLRGGDPAVTTAPSADVSTFAATPAAVPPVAPTSAGSPTTAAAATTPQAAQPQPQPKPQPKPQPQPLPASEPDRDQHPAVAEPPASYKNCDAVRAAGNAPLLLGQPGYNRKLDRDGDGVACEK